MTKFAVFLVALCLLASCSNYGQLMLLAKLPNNLPENSGLAFYGDSTVWLVQDSGNKAEIYKVDFKGTLLKTYAIKNSSNKDWEDLAQDKEGNLYIADTGNNANDRKDLVIYKLPNPSNGHGDKIDAKKIKFHYPEQKQFPPKKKELLYDSEALFYNNDHLFIITKNRATPFSGEALVYKVPAKEGNYTAQFIAKLFTCNDGNRCKVTSADISPNGKTIVLLGSGILWVYPDFKGDDFTKGDMHAIDLKTATQLESVCFLDDTTLLLSDEKTGITGGNLYLYSIK